MTKLHIGLTVSGAVSLGAYEGGALASLLVASEDLREHLVIDAIAGASAGAMTGLVTARCLATGADPVESMKRAWVDLPDIENLATHHEDSPLSARRLAEEAIKILGPDGPKANPDRRQAEPVQVTMAMCSLAGLGYQIAVTKDSAKIDAVTYLDWSESTFDGSSTLDDFVAAAPRALASGANAAGFPPALVKHTQAELDQLRDAGVQNTERLAASWYTDGGTLDNEPFGRLLDMVGHDGADVHRLMLLVHPIPTVCPGDSDWNKPSVQPRWPRTALRVKSLQGDQSIFEDLRALSKINTRLEWVDEVVAALSGLLKPPAEADAAVEAATQSALAALVAKLDAQHEALNQSIGRSPSARPQTESADVAELLREAICRATGLAGKRRAVVEIVSPALDESHKPAADLLAGEKLGHFFGFFDEHFRKSDFALGYRNMQTWMTTRLNPVLVALNVPDTTIAEATAHVKVAYDEIGWDNERYGDADFESLSVGDKLRFVGLLAHIAHITERDVRHWDDGLPVEAAGALP